MTSREILFALLMGLLINEFSDLSPWLATRVVRWAARVRYGRGTSRADVRAEEWTTLIQSRPGKLFKLATGLGLAATATGDSSGA